MGDSLEPALAPVPAKKSGFDQLRLHNAEYIVNNVPRWLYQYLPIAVNNIKI